MPAALSGASPVVSTQLICPMDLLEASLGSVPAAAARKASKTCATQRQFWGGKNNRFKGEMRTDGSDGQIWHIRCHADAHMDVSNEGVQGGEVGSDRGDRKVVTTHGMMGTVGLWRHNDVLLLLAHMLVKKYCHHMILRWCPTNLGSLYTMVPSDWHGNAV